MTNNASSLWLQIGSLARNLLSGVRGVFFLRLTMRESDSTSTQLVMLMIARLCVQLAWDFFNVGWNGELTTFGLPGVLFDLPILLFVAWMLAHLAKQADKTLTLAVVFCAIAIPFDALTPALQWLPGRLLGYLSMHWSYENYPAIIAWFALSCAIAALRLLAIPKWQWRLPVVFLVIVVIGFPLIRTYRDSALWVAPYDRNKASEEMDKRDALTNEDVFYQQPRLLQQELDALVPQRHEGINLFFVGVAGFSEQDVFMKEIKYVDKLFKDRFDTQGHSILLVNNPNTVTQLPIASVTSLGLALKKVGDTMDKDKDILFLYLTSHGSQDHQFSLDFGSMKFKNLDPPRLRKLLDDSGIKHRVVVVGACYSGGFVDALKGDDTLVITSAASDRTSFGCSDDEDFTYFGRAYFADSLSKTDSFIDAFTLAKPVIVAREKEDDFTPSNPQISVGEAIKVQLSAFGKQQLALRVTHDAAQYKSHPVATTPVANPVVDLGRNVGISKPAQENASANNEQLEAARKLVALTGYEAMIQDAVEECKESSLKNGSPEKLFEKNKNAFQGLTPQSSQWPKLVEAYRKYWEQSCNSVQGDVYPDILAQSYVANMSKQQVVEATKFLSSPTGRAFVASEQSGSRSFVRESANSAEVARAKAAEEYNKTLANLIRADGRIR